MKMRKKRARKKNTKKMTDKFTSKTILSNQTLGDKLKRTREESGLVLEDISHEIKIKEEYLSYLETGQYNKLPGPVFIKNYLKKYSAYLQLSWQTVESMYEKEIVIFRQKEEKNISPKYSQKALVIPKIVYGLLIVFVLMAVGLYLVLEISNFTQPPSLEVYDLPDQLTISEHTVTVQGKTQAGSQVFINEQEISLDEAGSFYETISLQTGLNTIKVAAKKKHSKERVIYKQIFVEGDNN